MLTLAPVSTNMAMPEMESIQCGRRSERGALDSASLVIVATDSLTDSSKLA